MGEQGGSHVESNVTYNINVNENQYSSLSEDDEGEDSRDFQNVRRRPKRPLQTGPIEGGKKPKSSDSGPEVKMPPIKAFNINVKKVHTALISKLASTEYYIQNINKNMSVIHTTTLKNYTTALELLKEIKAKCYTYTPKESRAVNLILRGIHNTFNELEIVDSLKNLSFKDKGTRIVNAYKYTTNRSRTANRELSLYMVQFTPQAKIQDVMEMKFFEGQRIEWEMTRSHDIIQCKKCQRFGHVAINCFMPYRCVKCTSEHEPGNCQLQPRDTNNINSDPTIQETNKNTEKTASNSIPKCVNCKMEGHPASYRNCTMYKKIKQRAEEREKIRREQHQQVIEDNWQSTNQQKHPQVITVNEKTFPNLRAPPRPLPSLQLNKTTPNKSYSHTLKTTNTKTDNRGNAMSFIDNECEVLFGSDLMSIVTEVQNFIPIYKQQQTKNEKQMCLINFILRLVNTP